MSFLNKLRLPYSDDRIYGFLLLAILIVPTAIAPQFTDTAIFFSDPIDTVKLIVWSLFVGLIFLFVWHKSSSQSILPKPLVWLLLAMLGWSIVILPFSYDKLNSIFGVAFRMNNSLWIFTIWAGWIWLLSTVSKDKFRVLVTTYLITSFLVAGLAILENYGIGFYAGLSTVGRPLIPSFLGNPNFASMFIVGSIPLLIWQIISEVHRGWRLAYIFSLASTAWALGLFSSRAALLGVAAGMLVLFVITLWQRRWKVALVMLAAVTVIATIGLLYVQVTRPEVQSIESSDVSTAQRYYVWDIASRFVLEHPITGSGLGNYFIAYRQNHETQLAAASWFDDPHNIVLYLAVSGGVVLALIFILIVGIPIWQGLRQSIIDRGEIAPAVWASSIIAWLVTAGFGPVSVPNWLVLGFFIVGLYQFMPVVSYPVKSKLFYRSLGVLGVIFIFMGIAFTTSEVLSWQAAIQLQNHHEQTALKLIKMAVIANPINAAVPGNWAIIARENHNSEESDKALQYSVKQHPRSSAILEQVLLGYIRLWSDTKDTQYRDKAYEVLEKYQASNRNYFITYSDSTVAYLALGDSDKSLQAAKKTVVLANQNAESWVLLAQVYKTRGDREKMLAALENAFELKPSPILNRALREAKKEPDITKIILPFELPNFAS